MLLFVTLTLDSFSLDREACRQCRRLALEAQQAITNLDSFLEVKIGIREGERKLRKTSGSSSQATTLPTEKQFIPVSWLIFITLSTLAAAF